MRLKVEAGYGMENGKSHVTDVTRRTASLTRWNRDKHSDWSGMAEWRDYAKTVGRWRDERFKKAKIFLTFNGLDRSAVESKTRCNLFQLSEFTKYVQQQLKVVNNDHRS